MNRPHFVQQSKPDYDYSIVSAYSQLRNAKKLENFIYFSCIIFIGYLWVWLLAIWWLIAYRRVDAKFISEWKKFPTFQGGFPYNQNCFELVTKDLGYQAKLDRKNAIKTAFMGLLAVPILGYVFFLVSIIMTFGIIIIFLYLQMQAPRKYLIKRSKHSFMTTPSERTFTDYSMTDRSGIQDQTVPRTEGGIFCGRCGKSLPKKARYCNVCAYPVKLPEERQIDFQRVSFKQAVDLLDSETYPRNTMMNIEFECVVVEQASPEYTHPYVQQYRTIRVTDPGRLITRNLFVCGDPNRRHNINLISTLEEGMRLLIIGPNRPINDPKLNKDENGNDMFWISNWDGTSSGKGTRLLKLKTISDIKVEEQSFIPVKLEDVVETTKEATPIKQIMIAPPFYCQLCSIKHKAGTPRMQCEVCGRYVCIEAFTEMVQVGRKSCPMCDGKLSSV